MLARFEQRSSGQAQKEVSGSAIRIKALTSKKLAETVARFANDKKAQDIVVLDMRHLVNFCDYFVIASGTSDRHVKSIAQGIDEGLAQMGINAHLGKHLRAAGGGHPPENSEGAWMLLDLGDVVAHIFEPQAREFYGLEYLWQDAPVIKFKKSF